MGRILPIFNRRVFGVKPGRDAPKLDRLRWYRRYYLVNLAIIVPAAVWIAIYLPSWIFVVLVGLPWLLGFIRLNLELRRERRHHQP
jgi:hypothetical protein